MRLLPRFGLRSLLVGLTIVAVLRGPYASRFRKYLIERELATKIKTHGGSAEWLGSDAHGTVRR